MTIRTAGTSLTVKLKKSKTLKQEVNYFIFHHCTLTELNIFYADSAEKKKKTKKKNNNNIIICNISPKAVETRENCWDEIRPNFFIVGTMSRVEIKIWVQGSDSSYRLFSSSSTSTETKVKCPRKRGAVSFNCWT